MTHAIESNKNSKLIEELGYTTERHSYFGRTFHKQDRHVWPIRSGWQTADLVNGFYKNHKPFAKLEDALKRELTE